MEKLYGPIPPAGSIVNMTLLTWPLQLQLRIATEELISKPEIFVSVGETSVSVKIRVGLSVT